MEILKKVTVMLVLLFSPFNLMTQAIILFDASGSMRGFYRAGDIYKLEEKLNNITKKYFSPVKTFIFQYETIKSKGIKEMKTFANITAQFDTLIDKAFQEVIKIRPSPKVIWLITDNVQDPPGGGEVAGEIERFYELLRQPEVEGIYVFPMKLQFNGPYVYATIFQSFYTGKAALVAYFILLSNSKKDNLKFHSLAAEAVKVLSDFEAMKIKCKPISYRSIIFSPLRYKRENSANLKILKIQEGRPHHKFSGNVGNIHLISNKYRKSVKYEFKFKGKSLFSNIDLINIELKGGNLKDIKISGFFKKPKGWVTIRPAKATFIHGQICRDTFILSVYLSNIKIKKSLKSLLAIPFKKKGTIEGMVTVKIIIPNRSFQLSSELIQAYNSKKPRPDKLYHIDQLIPSLSDRKEEIPIVWHLKLDMRYPSWPTFVLLGIIAGLSAFSIILMRSIRNSVKTFTIEIEGESKELQLIPFLSKRIDIKGWDALKITLKGNKLYLEPLEGFEWGEGQRDVKIFDIDENPALVIFDVDGNSYSINIKEKKEEESDVEIEETEENFWD